MNIKGARAHELPVSCEHFSQFQLAAENSLFPSSDLEGFRTLSLELWDFENEEIEPC